MTIRAVLFDFDGVIAQTETYKLNQMMKQLDQLHVTYTREQIFSLAGTIGSEVRKLMHELFKNDPNFILHQEELLSYRADRPNLKDIKTKYIDELLAELKHRGIKIAVASNSSAHRLEEAIKLLEIEQYFDLVASATDLGRLKPDPFVYLYAMDTFHTTGDETIVVEDSRLGITAGKKAGAYVAALKDEYGAINQNDADRVLDDIRKVIDFIDELENL